VVFAAQMAGRHHGVRIEIDATDERRLGFVPGIHEPALLVLAEHPVRAVPAGAKARATRAKHVMIGLRACENGVLGPSRLGIVSPEDRPNIEAPRYSAIQHIEQRAASVRHPEGRQHERHRDEDAVPGCLDRRANAPEGGFAVDQRTHQVAGPHRV